MILIRGGGVMDDNLYIQFSRPLEPDEHVCLLRRGSAKRDDQGCIWADNHLSSIPISNYPSRYRRRNRWIVYYNGSILEDSVPGYSQIIEWPLEYHEQFDRNAIAATFEWDGGTSDNAYLIKDAPYGSTMYTNVRSKMGFRWHCDYNVGEVFSCARILVGPYSKRVMQHLSQYPWHSLEGNPCMGYTFGIGVYKAAKYRTKYGTRVLTKVQRVSNVCYFRKFFELAYHEEGGCSDEIIDAMYRYTKIP